jgi:hypothetical protein
MGIILAVLRSRRRRREEECVTCEQDSAGQDVCEHMHSNDQLRFNLSLFCIVFRFIESIPAHNRPPALDHGLDVTCPDCA